MSYNREAFEDAVNYCMDEIFADKEYLIQILLDNISDSLTFWPEFDDALYEASYSPEQEEELRAMDHHIVKEVVSRLSDKIEIKFKDGKETN